MPCDVSATALLTEVESQVEAIVMMVTLGLGD